MKEKDEIRLDLQLWDLVKGSTKKINPKERVAPNPKKSFLKKKITNPVEIINNKEKKTNIDKTSNISHKINFIDSSNTGGVRNKDLKNLKSGKFKIQSKLDLHGFKLNDAQNNFYDFIYKNYEQSNRNLLVITGKGQDGKGKIRKDIHTWINNSSLIKLVIFYSHASPKDGGEGAFYIRLRKNF